jgi:hypothetical protein
MRLLQNVNKLLSVSINQSYCTYKRKAHTEQRDRRQRSGKWKPRGQITEGDTDGGQVKRE